MANLNRIRAHWTGITVEGPSISTFYWDATDVGGPAAIRTFFEDLAGLLPTGTTVQVDGTGDVISDSNGALVDTWTEVTPLSVAGTNTNGFVLGLGMRVVWATEGITRGRRVRGSTFIVPVARDSWDAQGTPSAGVVTLVDIAAQKLVVSGVAGFKIWSKPTTVAAANGHSSQVVGALVPDAVSWLRSRRT